MTMKLIFKLNLLIFKELLLYVRCKKCNGERDTIEKKKKEPQQISQSGWHGDAKKKVSLRRTGYEVQDSWLLRPHPSLPLLVPFSIVARHPVSASSSRASSTAVFVE